jgi:hypothetical protein
MPCFSLFYAFLGLDKLKIIDDWQPSPKLFPVATGRPRHSRKWLKTTERQFPLSRRALCIAEHLSKSFRGLSKYFDGLATEALLYHSMQIAQFERRISARFS